MLQHTSILDQLMSFALGRESLIPGAFLLRPVIRILLFFVLSLAASIEVLVRMDFGARYIRGSYFWAGTAFFTGFAVLAVSVFDSTRLFWKVMPVVFIFVGLGHGSVILVRRRLGEERNSLYAGTSLFGLMLFKRVPDRMVKRVIEPLLAVLLGVWLWRGGWIPSVVPVDVFFLVYDPFFAWWLVAGGVCVGAKAWLLADQERTGALLWSDLSREGWQAQARGGQEAGFVVELAPDLMAKKNA